MVIFECIADRREWLSVPDAVTGGQSTGSAPRVVCAAAVKCARHNRLTMTPMKFGASSCCAAAASLS